MKSITRMKVWLGVIMTLCMVVANGQTSKKNYTKQVEFEVLPVFGVNTEYNEFSPVLYQDYFVFTSDREYDYKTLGEGNWKKAIHLNVFKAKFENIFSDSVVLEKITLFDNAIVLDDHVGPITFNKNQDQAIVTIVTHKNAKPFSKSVATPQLYKIEKINGKWKNLELLPFNTPTYSLSHPAWSPDGKYLYFALNKEPQSNKSDIYRVEKKGESWGTVEKVKELNTKGNDMFPYLMDNKIYFASERKEGYGGLDLYVSEMEDGKWSTPKNLGKTINTEADEFAMVFNVNKTSGYFCSNRSYGKGKDDIFKFNRIEKTLVEDKGLGGVLTYRYLKSKPVDGLEIGMYDDDGNLLQTAKVNADGTFIFEKLPTDGKFTLKMMQPGEEVEVMLDGNEKIVLLSDKQGNFIYRKLSAGKVGTLALMDEEDIDLVNGQGELSGQFVFKKLKSGDIEGMDVFLVDEDGNIVMTTKTDEYGNFIFKKVPTGSNYTLKTNSGEDFDILVFNKKEQLLARLAKDKDGNFVFRKLKLQSNSDNLLETNEEDLIFIEKRVALTGQFVYPKVKKNVGVLGVEVHDEQELLKTTETTEEGDFMAVGLAVSDQYKFRITDESKLKEEPKLNITNRYHQTVAVLNRNPVGFYVFDKSEDFNLGDSVVNIEVIQIEQTDIHNTEIIYYENDEYILTEDDKVILDKKIKELKADPELLIRIESYASSKGTVEHNKILTQKRKAKVLQYLTANGIHQSRIKAFSYGKERSQEEQDEEQQRLSRKTELTIFKLK